MLYRVLMSKGKPHLILISALFWASFAASSAQAAQNVRAGRVLAIDACSACHQITPDQKPRPPVFNPDEYAHVTAPPFSAIAMKYNHRPWTLRRFILLPKHPMPEQNWDPADLTAVINFILSPPSGPSPPARKSK
jgi:mono/diheme cytochrome c family protein